jgi:hypothetical protein
MVWRASIMVWFRHVILPLPFIKKRLFQWIILYSAHYPAQAHKVKSLVFAGKDPSRALATSSLKVEDCRADWYDLGDKEKTVLDEWMTFFSKRYNIIGKVQGATNQ